MDKVILPPAWSGWKITEYLGSGSYGRVYEIVFHEGCEDEDHKALKIIQVPAQLTEFELMMREYKNQQTVHRYYASLVEDMVREIEMMDTLKGNPHIASIEDYTVTEKDGVWTIYIRMELLRSLDDYLSDITFGEKEVIRLGREICQALAECEKHKIIHRDIKPDNILVTEDGSYKLADFGVARRMNQGRNSMSVKGTFAYMAPEVFRGTDYSHTADIYSLGLVLYRLMNRMREPFVDLDKQIVYYRDREESQKRRLSAEKLPAPVNASEEFSEIILRACAYSPEDRYPSAARMLQDLTSLEQGTYLFREPSVGTEITEKKGRQRKNLLGAAGLILFFLLAYILGKPPVGGSLGGEVRWKLDRHGKMVLSGEGEASVKGDSYPWDRYKSQIRSFEVEEGITGLGPGFLRDCHRLQTITLPDSLTFLGDYAFYNCDRLESVVVPSSLTAVGDCVWARCSRLEDVRLGEETVTFGSDVFEGTPWRRKEMQQNGGLLIAGDVLLEAGSGLHRLRVPQGVVRIGAGACQNADKLVLVDLPDSVRFIEREAFQNCIALETVHFPEGLEVIDDNAFCGDSRLKEIGLPSSLTRIGSWAFADCLSLTGVTLPGQARIYPETFENTPWLSSEEKNGLFIRKGLLIRCDSSRSELTLPEGIRAIGTGAFDSAPQIRYLTLPKSLRFIEYQGMPVRTCRIYLLSGGRMEPLWKRKKLRHADKDGSIVFDDLHYRR